MSLVDSMPWLSPLYMPWLSYEFRTSLVVCSEISGLMLPVTRYLQTKSIDLFQAKRWVVNLQNVLKERRENVDESFDLIFNKVNDVADQHDVQPKAPRVCNRQTKRSNTGQGQDVKQYYRVNLYIPFIDHCLVELEDRFGPQFLKLCQLQCFLPNFITKASTEEIKKAVEFVQYHDILKNELLLETEIWKQMWKDETSGKVPETALSSLHLCNATLYPNIRKILKVLCVLPVTSAEPERSFSTLRRLKTWLRATTSENRLNGLALLNIHNKIFVNPEAVVECFANRGKRRMDLLF